MTPFDLTFYRRFSYNPYKTLRLPLGEMSLHKDWVHTDRGDPYPLLHSEGDGTETVDGQYTFTGTGSKTRLLGYHFPYATYEMQICDLQSGAAAGFTLEGRTGGHSQFTAENVPALTFSLCRQGDMLQVKKCLRVGETVTEEMLGEPFPYRENFYFLVGTRGANFDIYFRFGTEIRYFVSCTVPAFAPIRHRGTFLRSVAGVTVAGGTATLADISFFLDGGISHADIKPVRYEDGTVMTENGKMYFTMSSRLQEGGFQSVLSWSPTTMEFSLVGAMFFDCGDGLWCSDVATSLLYNRPTGEWYLWACSFSHGHILMHATIPYDPRFGINGIETVLMETEQTAEREADSLGATAGAGKSFVASLSDDRLWLAKTGDEDPDFIYDAQAEKWYMTICRCVAENGKNHYRYFLFESEKPFSGYRYLAQTDRGENTGGLIIPQDGKLYFCCGSDFSVHSRYYLYELPHLDEPHELKADFPDGGFRGWGTIFRLPLGSRMRTYWLTFDRHGGSAYNWSYGNLYLYEAEEE